MRDRSPPRDAAVYALVPALVLPEDKVLTVPAGVDSLVQIAVSRRYVIKDAAHGRLWIVRRSEFDVPRLVKVKVGDEVGGGGRRERPPSLSPSGEKALVGRGARRGGCSMVLFMGGWAACTFGRGA